MDLDALSENIAGHFDVVAKNARRGVKFVQMVFIILGTIVAGACEAIEIAQLGHGVSSLTIVSLTGIICVGLANSLHLFQHEDVVAVVNDARIAVEKERKGREAILQMQQEMEIYQGHNGRHVQLYISISSMITALRGAVALGECDVEATIQRLLDDSIDPLLIALDFQMQDNWTFCVYRAEGEGATKRRLRCVAHQRKTKCDLAEARVWEEGVGAAGIAYSNQNTVVIGDMTSASVAPLLAIRDVRDYDAVRYRSLVAIPIKAGGAAWGVVVVTSDRCRHFDREQEGGYPTVEPIQALAEIVSLTVSIHERASVNGDKWLARRNWRLKG